jgi:hypothetical protein
VSPNAAAQTQCCDARTARQLPEGPGAREAAIPVNWKRGTAASVVAALGIGLAVVAWWGQTAQGSLSIPPVREDSAALQARVDAIYETFDGTVYERDAAGVVQAYSLNGAMDRCMRRQGYPEWDWSTPRSKDGPGPAFWFTDFFSPPLAATHSTVLVAMAPASVAEQTALSQDIDEVQQSVIGFCSHRTRTGQAQGTPREALRLRQQWWDMLAELDATYGDMEQYRACLRATDFGDDLGRLGSTTDAAMALERLDPPAGERVEGAESGSPAWRRLVEAEAAWERGEYACRHQVYNAHLDDAAAEAEQFARTHAAAISDARAAWRKVTRRAERLGYDGTYKPLGAD